MNTPESSSQLYFRITRENDITGADSFTDAIIKKYNLTEDHVIWYKFVANNHASAKKNKTVP